MAKSRLNMVSLMNIAWDRRCNSSHEEFEVMIKNLLSHSFVELERIYQDWCYDKGRTYNDEVFYLYQRIIISIMLCDGEFLQGEYDAYLKYCSWAGFKALSVSEVRSLHSRISSDELIADINLITGMREYFDPENYEALVKGFCFFSLAGDKSFDENEYYIIRCFFDSYYDYVPSTWEQFKREWC